ncbi:GatB/YqeY domain-containing protein, partial [Thelephora terrestris]
LRAQLLADLKAAMKNKNTMASTTIRAVLADVYAADKSQTEKIPDSGIVPLLRKASQRRVSALIQFEKGGREDLAAKEKEEHALLTSYLPSLLPGAEIDRVLKPIADGLKATAKPGETKRLIGLVFKSFYSQVDRSSVDPDLVKRRAEALLAGI